MGLLDMDMTTPEAQGFNSALMQAAAMLLTPRHRGGGVGSAFAAMPQAIQRAQEQAMRGRMMGLQEQQMGMQGQKFGLEMDEYRRKLAQDARQQQMLADFVKTLPPEQQQAAMLAPNEFIKTLIPQAPKLETIFTPDGQEQKAWVRGPGFEPQPVGGPKQPQMPWEYEIGPDGQPRMRPGVFNAKTSIAQAGAARNNVNLMQEREESKTVGKYFGEQFADIQKAGMDAYGKVNRLNRLESLLQGVSTGKLTPAATEVKAALSSLGIDIDPNLGAAQAAQAITNELALQMRNPSGGAGMPGAMSDKDREFLQATVPGLAKTPQGNKLLIESYRRLAQRDQQVAKAAREYRKQHGSLDEGFYEQLHAFSEANPLFADMPQSTVPAAPALPSGWSVQRVK